MPQTIERPATLTTGRGGADPTIGAGGPEGSAQIMVNVLGPVEITGAVRPFRRAWTVDLVVYLALHRRGSTTEAWATALWPDRLMAPPTLYSTASAARRALGRSAATGRDHLPHGHGRLQLAPSVATDWHRLVAAVDGSPDQAEAALALVRGRPLEGLRSPDWTVLEGIGAEIEETVTALATTVADRHLGQPAAPAGPGSVPPTRAERAARATWAARQGLRASPYDERLYRRLLRAADLRGNPGGVESVMAELVRLLGGPGADSVAGGRVRSPTGLALVHPRTAELYLSLTRRTAASGGGPARQ